MENNSKRWLLSWWSWCRFFLINYTLAKHGWLMFQWGGHSLLSLELRPCLPYWWCSLFTIWTTLLTVSLNPISWWCCWREGVRHLRLKRNSQLKGEKIMDGNSQSSHFRNETSFVCYYLDLNTFIEHWEQHLNLATCNERYYNSQGETKRLSSAWCK